MEEKKGFTKFITGVWKFIKKVGPFVATAVAFFGGGFGLAKLISKNEHDESEEIASNDDIFEETPVEESTEEINF